MCDLGGGLAGAMLLTAVLATAALAAAPEDLPEAERAIADTVDPWGLAFSDALVRYRQRFEGAEDAHFALGINHALTKVFPNRYWYRGPSRLPGEEPARMDPLLAPAGQVQSFQVVALPAVGAPEREYSLSVELEGARGAEATIYREVFVGTSERAAYPRLHSERWPDPLVPESTARASQPDCAAFWVDVAIPADHPGGEIACTVRLTDGEQTAVARPIIEVVPELDLEPKGYPFVSWFGRRWGGGELSEEQFRGLCELVLAHHMQPVDALAGLWDADDPADFDAMHRFLAERGQSLFDLKVSREQLPAACEHVTEGGWIDQCLLYNSPDEPDDETFAAENIANNRAIHEVCPRVRTYLASEWHEDMAEGCDIWLTDVSASRYDPDEHRDLPAPALWHYYCHLPVRWQMRAPLVYAPNMQIDNQALEHRLALWMSYFTGAEGVFTWAGFRASGLEADFWETLELPETPSGFPYAGVHNGNNYRVYPPREEGGAVLPSIRLKVTRDALVDVAMFRLAEELLDGGELRPEQAGRLRELLDPTPEVFVDFHYWDREPDALLSHRDALVRALDGIVNG